MNTGLGVHERPVKMFAPRSCSAQLRAGTDSQDGRRTFTGQMKYL